MGGGPQRQGEFLIVFKMKECLKCKQYCCLVLTLFFRCRIKLIVDVQKFGCDANDAQNKVGEII